MFPINQAASIAFSDCAQECRFALRRNEPVAAQAVCAAHAPLREKLADALPAHVPLDRGVGGAHVFVCCHTAMLSWRMSKSQPEQPLVRLPIYAWIEDRLMPIGYVIRRALPGETSNYRSPA